MKIGSFFCWLSRICYAKKLKGWDSSSGRKIPSPVFKWFALFGVFCVMPLLSYASNWTWDELQSNNDYRCKMTWNPEKGVIHYRISVWQDWGSGYADGHQLMHNVYITQYSESAKTIYISYPETTSGKNDISYSGIDEVTWDWWDAGGGDRTYYMEFDLPISQGDLDKEITTNIKGTWYRHGHPSDGSINTNLKATCNYPKAQLKFEGDRWSYSCSEANNPLINIYWSNGATEHFANDGTVFLCESGSNKKVSLEGETSWKNVQNGKADGKPFRINVGTTDKIGDKPIHNLCYSKSYKIRYEYAPSVNKAIKYCAETGNITIPAYPQVKDFMSDLDMDNQKLNLVWTIPNAPTSDVQEGGFLLTITRKDSLNQILSSSDTIIPYVGGTTRYTLEIPLTEEDKKVTYECDIERNSTAHGSCYTHDFAKHLVVRDITTGHCYPKNPMARLSSDNTNVEIRWTRSGSYWSKGTKFIIKRTNEQGGAVHEFLLNESDYGKCVFVDDLVQTCKSYSYQILLEPAGAAYDPVTMQVKDEEDSTNVIFTPYLVGTVKDLEVSKGYYSDRVGLSWKTTSGFEDIIVERRECENEKSSFKKIYSVSTADSSEFIFDDVSCLPGVLYEYRVYGMLKCGNDDVSSIDTIYGYGFRTPTGDFNGRVTFDSGQGEDSVQIRFEAESETVSYALGFEGLGKVVIPGKSVLSSFSDDASATLQAWVYPMSFRNDDAVIIRKSGLCEVGLVENQVYVTIGDTTYTVDKEIPLAKYTHVSVVFDGVNKQLGIYLNGILSLQKSIDGVVIGSDATGDVVLGEKFVGQIDEVRLWSRPLGNDEIVNDYTRYLVGNEKGLDAYYTFEFMVESQEEAGETVKVGQVYDRSYSGREAYHGNIGSLYGVKKVESHLSIDELSYCAITDENGFYSVRAVPYFGNGTAYTMMPRKGVHQFSPTQAIRFIGTGTQSHTVDFVDKSSFVLSGVIVYSGGNYPVEGVHFLIDGKIAFNKSNEYVMTDADGIFNLNVPVGIHEVKAEKNGHVFALDGRVCDSKGNALNYQKDEEAKLYDNTKIKYVGRVAGGTVQEAYPVGHSLSKNNLANGITVKLTHTRDKYKMQDGVTTVEKHFTPNHPTSKKMVTHVNQVDYMEDGVLIHVNDTTGEFVAYVAPEAYTVEVNANGHPDINGSGSLVDFSSAVTYRDSTVYTYMDSVDADGWRTFHDTVRFNKSQLFIKRYKPTLNISQCKGNGSVLPYFGEREIVSSNILGENENVSVYDEKTNLYYLGSPIFHQGVTYYLKAFVNEEYRHTNTDELDIVPVMDGKFDFSVNFADGSKSIQVEADTNGIGFISFLAGEPEMTTATSSLSAKVICGNDDNPTSIAWDCPFAVGGMNKVYVKGEHMKGTNFVTAGPDKVLTVLRDPPGSNSYSFLEKGVSFTESSTYTGSVQNEGFEGANIVEGVKVKIYNGVVTPATLVAQEESAGTTNTTKVGVAHEESYEAANQKTSTTTLTTRFQTSDDPLYVGANGDVYVGYSTNMYFGESDAVSLIKKKEYLAHPNKYEVVYTDTTGKDYVLVKSAAISLNQSFNTLFAFPQVYIEQTLIPNMENLKRSILIVNGINDTLKYKQLAEETGETYYLSYLSENDPDFGKSNSDESIKNTSNGIAENNLDGPSYKVISPTKEISKDMSIIIYRDTIKVLNQWIKAWKDRMSENEEQKVYFSDKIFSEYKVSNYSFHAGSPIEYTEEYSSGRSNSSTFSFNVGVAVENSTDVEVETINYLATTFAIEEKVTTTQGGSFESEVERSHSKGFVLAEDGDDDYLSVDVYREKKWTSTSEEYDNPAHVGAVDTTDLADKDYYSSFVFITRGGATSCPYEKAYETQYYEKGKVIGAQTMQLEVPSISIENDFVENVPSGEEAFFTLYLRNNSETNEDQWFDLRLIDASNPDGAIPTIDGNSMSGFALDYLVPAGETLVKTMSVAKGRALNYDNLQLVLSSKCQSDPTSFLDVIADTAAFSVHFIPSCTDVSIVNPSNNWTYNTNCATDTVQGVVKHYMPITISEFDVNYADFEHLELQYKSASSSDNDWITLVYYYKSDSLTQKAMEDGFNAFTISSEDAGNIYYNFYMDNLPDQKYDLRAVSFCNINNELYENPSEVVSGIKDMYIPRLFGSPKPANGVLTIDDDIRIDFNETIAEGMLTINNFEITGVRNGVASDHSVAIALDGENDYLTTEVTRNFANKDLTFECWVNYDSLQNATFFSHGDATESISMGMNKEGKIVAKVGAKEVVSEIVPAWEKSSWNHVALVYNNENKTVTAYVNYMPVINSVNVEAYKGDGVIEVGRNVASANGYFNGKVDQFRIWNSVRSSATIQANCTSQLSGNDLNLMAYYEMEEAKGAATEDKARGANLLMKGGSWALPEGRSAEFNGQSYVAMNSSSAVITSDMDFTLEFWFNAESEAKGQTLISNGTGLASDAEDATKLFSVGFDPTGALTFRHNGYVTPLEGDFSDNNWHNFTLAVSRSSGVARIYVDGELNTYFSADKIGGIASDKLFAGARVYYVANDSTTVAKQRKADQYFSGRIDEVRLWNLYRQQSQVENFYNQKVNGDEMGLLLYYPFEHYVEWQGRSEMQFTLEDKGNDALDGNGKKLAFATMQGEVSESQNIPPVKTKGATSSLAYEWVVNDDALIITLQEQDYRIEKAIVNFTVNQVQDVNGNYIVSPITWSAYIDRNQLKWMDDAVTVNKKQNEPYKFEMPIVNKGGSVINYSLKNMPSWLSASPESGAINPLEKQTIEFEIDPSLAVGTYDEVVYLTNSNNVTEPLALNVTVEGDTPEWSVDPSKYEFSMAVFAQIKLDNQFSNDEKDMLAAFYNGECVGVANMSYDKTMDLWYAMMTVYSNSKSHGLVYRAWDASKGIMTEAVSSPVVSFEADTVYGKPTAPVVFYNGATKYQNISLSKGWNWVSFNLENKAGMSDLNAYLNSGRWGSNSIVKDLSGRSANYSVDGRKWLNDSLVLNNTNMFKIYSDENQVLSVSGKDINLDSTMIPVKAGSWNYIAYLPAGSMSLKAALAGYNAKEGDVIKSNEGFAMYYGNEWIGSLNSLQPNCGYMLKNTGDVQKTFRYPSSSSALRSAVSVKSSAYESNMSIIASAPEKREGDLLRALVGTEENNVVEVVLSDDYALQFINVSAKAGDKVRFTMERDGVTYEANNALTFTGDAVYGTPDNPFVLNFNVGGVETLTVYPNPMDAELNVAGKLDGEGDVTLELFDVLGVLVFEKQVSAQDNVLDESINVSGLVPGSYMLKVNQGDESKVFKVVKK